MRLHIRKYSALHAAGRKIAVVNLDPANDVLPYQPDIDIMELVSLDEVMQELKLGPNGGQVPLAVIVSCSNAACMS